MTLQDRVRVEKVETLSNDYYLLEKTTLAFQRSDGSWQTQTRETYDRGHGATILLYNLEYRTVVLVRQFRFPAFKAGYPDLLLETPAGLLDGADPAHKILEEVEEETGFRISDAVKLFEAFMSPGSVTEKLHFFAAQYDSNSRVSQGGGLEHEGEDIETLELNIDDAVAKISSGEIQDGKTIMLLQYAQLHLFARDRT